MMSNNTIIYLWDAKNTAINDNFSELFLESQQLIETDNDASDSLLAFAQDLAAYQEEHLDDYDSDDDCYNFLDSIAREISTLTKAACTIYLPEDWERMFRVIVEYAKKHQLTLICEELTFALVSNGKMLPAKAAWAWDNLVEKLNEEDRIIKEQGFPRTIKQYQIWVQPIYDELLGHYGFNRVDKIEGIGQDYFPESTYLRAVPTGEQVITIQHTGTRPYFWSITSFSMMSKLVDDIYQKVEFQKFDPTIFSGELRFLANIEISSYSQQPLNMDLAKSYAMLTVEYILPLFDKARDINGLDNVMNGVYYTKSIGDYPSGYSEGYLPFLFYAPQCLIVSRLASSPNFEKLQSYFEAVRSFGVNDKVRATEWPKLVKYLQEEVKPLV